MALRLTRGGLPRLTVELFDAQAEGRQSYGQYDLSLAVAYSERDGSLGEWNIPFVPGSAHVCPYIPHELRLVAWDGHLAGKGLADRLCAFSERMAQIGGPQVYIELMHARLNAVQMRKHAAELLNAVHKCPLMTVRGLDSNVFHPLTGEFLPFRNLMSPDGPRFGFSSSIRKWSGVSARELYDFVVDDAGGTAREFLDLGPVNSGAFTRQALEELDDAIFALRRYGSFAIFTRLIDVWNEGQCHLFAAINQEIVVGPSGSREEVIKWCEMHLNSSSEIEKYVA